MSHSCSPCVPIICTPSKKWVYELSQTFSKFPSSILNSAWRIKTEGAAGAGVVVRSLDPGTARRAAVSRGARGALFTPAPAPLLIRREGGAADSVCVSCAPAVSWCVRPLAARTLLYFTSVGPPRRLLAIQVCFFHVSQYINVEVLWYINPKYSIRILNFKH